MALRDIFKKKKPPAEKKIIEKPVEKPPKAAEPKIREKQLGEAWKILKSPQVTEKATDLTKQNQYVFKAWSGANKTEIKKTIEGLYGVNVLSVKIINVPPKQRRLGKIKGWRKSYKKAIVKIKEGQKIEVLPR